LPILTDNKVVEVVSLTPKCQASAIASEQIYMDFVGEIAKVRLVCNAGMEIDGLTFIAFDMCIQSFSVEDAISIKGWKWEWSCW
jgi:hypothetical protein